MPKLLTSLMETWNYESGPHILRRRSHLAVYIAEVVSIGSQIEQAWANFIASAAKFDAPTAVAILESVSNSSFQDKMLKTIAERHLAPDDLSYFHKVRKATGSCAETRNRFCHWVWAVSDAIPNGLILLKHTNHARFAADIAFNLSDADGYKETPNLAEGAVVYFEQDFLEAYASYENALSAVWALNRLISTNRHRDQEFRSMALVEIENALKQLIK